MNQLIIAADKCRSHDFVLLKDIQKIVHIKDILKLSVGDRIKICILGQGRFIGTIHSLQADLCTISILETLKTRPLGAKTHLIIGLSRPPTIKKILEHATSMGVTSFSFYKTTLSEKSYLKSKILQKNEYQKFLELGLAQSACMIDLPKVHFFKNFSEMSKNDEFQRIISVKNRFILHPDEKHLPLTSHLNQVNIEDHRVIVVGSERGFTAEEFRNWKDDFKLKPIWISSSILRVEMAVYYSLAQLQLIEKTIKVTNGLNNR